MLKCPAAFREYNSIVVSLAVDEEAPRWCQDNIGKTVIDSSSHDVADNEVEQERSCHCPCLTPVTTSNGVVCPAGTRTAAVVR
ncbi:hypothetical protein RB195_021862 [Necator americanus]|uniref:Uncharacterized protein n=1 Tax=Necator americanus TaxID=51031 RepID=A0ABR1ED97_NECAM